MPFYVIAPLLYLVFHFYLLMMLVLLARTAAEFEKQLRGDARRTKRSGTLPGAGRECALPAIAGRDERRAGWLQRLLLASIALITIVLAPLATLILMQMMFLPYHSFGITWWHRAS